MPGRVPAGTLSVSFSGWLFLVRADGFFGAEGDFVEGDGHLDLEVLALGGGAPILEALGAAVREDPAAAAAGAGGAPPQAAEEPAEDAFGDAGVKDVVEIEPPEDVLLGKLGLEGLGTELVVFLAFIGVTEDGVGLADLFEPGLGVSLVALGLVGMIFLSQLPVGFFNFTRSGFAVDPQKLVIIVCHNINLKTCRSLLPLWQL